MTAAGVTSNGPGREAGPGEQSGGTASIGSVLDALRTDFPEITISKIRFLESEGLIFPARTPSGYRQFAPADVARLRFVLSAQRDHYLPLKVIRAKLDEFDRAPTPDGPTLAGEPAALATPPAPASAAPSGGPTAVPTPHPVATPVPGGPGGGGPGRGAPGAGGSGGGAPGGDRSWGPGRGGSGGDLRDPRDPSVPAPPAGSRSAGPIPPVPAPRERPPGVGGPVDVVDLPPDDAHGPDRAALLGVEGVDEALLEGLAAHGVLRPDAAGRYEPEAPLIARTAAALAVLGVEPRLLRGLRASADREVGQLAQLITPVARGRAPDATERAATLARELATLSGRLHALLVAAGLREGRR